MLLINMIVDQNMIKDSLYYNCKMFYIKIYKMKLQLSYNLSILHKYYGL
jgi:hypothetical protein